MFQQSTPVQPGYSLLDKNEGHWPLLFWFNDSMKLSIIVEIWFDERFHDRYDAVPSSFDDSGRSEFPDALLVRVAINIVVTASVSPSVHINTQKASDSHQMIYYTV